MIKNQDYKKMNSLYQQKIMDHYHFPRNKGVLEGATCRQSELSNPSCGDQITVFLSSQNNKIYDAKFLATGCILSLAAADMLLERLKNRSIDELNAITPEQIKEMIGIQVGPTRLKCILLPLQAVQQLYA